MKVLFHISHPAQYHMFKNTISVLRNLGHKVNITINTKDILEDLLIADGVNYINILKKRRKKNNKINASISLFLKTFNLFFYQLKEKHDILIGTETALSHIGYFFRKPSLIMVEDDVHVIPLAAKFSFPFATKIVAPKSCNLDKYSYKKIEYKGYQKLAYLHPKYFNPDINIVKEKLNLDERFFIIRVSDLNAYHDIDIKGFNIETIKKIITILEPYGNVLISTEKKLPSELHKYLFRADITKIHHFIYYSDLLIADSQSMCVEAAMLGTASIRFSDFAGRIGILEELEHLYDLTYGIKPDNSIKLFEKLNELLSIKDLKSKWIIKQKRMLDDSIDVTEFWVWLISNYPNSISYIEQNPNYQYKFKSVEK